MNDKFSYFIVPSAKYSLEWDGGQKMNVSGQELLDILWNHYHSELYLENSD